MKIVILSSSLFTDRVLLFSSFANLIKGKLKEDCSIEVWTSSYPLNINEFENLNLTIKEFPKISGFRERYNYLRKICNTAWSIRLKATSILSMNKKDFKDLSFKNKIVRIIVLFFSYLVCFFKFERKFEDFLHNLLMKQKRSKEAYIRLNTIKPDLLVITNPFWHYESAIAIEAIKLNIKIFSFIPSWDNITTKSRFVFKSDFYAVWSNIRKEELLKYYSYVQPNQIDVIGAPQYDVFFNEKFNENKIDFLNRNRLTNEKPIILYVLGSPNFIKSEVQTCIDVIDYFIKTGTINHIQVLVRPHPNKDNSELKEILSNKHKNVKIQSFKTSGLVTELRSQTEDQVVDWVSTFKYSDLLINLSSTSIFDALYFKKPVLNINFDHTKGKFFDEFIKEINAKWIHLRTVYDSNAIYYVNDILSIDYKIKEFLEDKLKSNGENLLETICYNSDGKSGEKLAQSIFKKLN